MKIVFQILLVGTPLCLAGAVSMASEETERVGAGMVEASKLGLPRLRPPISTDSAPRLPERVVQIDSLDVPSAPLDSGVEHRRVGGIDILDVGIDREWARPLWTADTEINFVSFGIYGSVGTMVSVGGAWLGIVESPIPGSGQLVAGTPSGSGIDWKPTGLHAQWTSYEGRLLASFSTLTVRLDRSRRVWDLYNGMRQKLDQMPWQPRDENEAKRIAMLGGIDGAWVTGLVQAVENPLFEDENDNGIDDAFELEARGELLAADTAMDERRRLAQAWRKSELSLRAPSLPVRAPASDYPPKPPLRRSVETQEGK